MKRIVLLTISLSLLVPALMLHAGAPEEGHDLFIARCGLCHQLPDPGMLTVKQWRKLLDTKQKLMVKAGMQKLTDDEYAVLFDFLKKSAKPGN